GYGHEALASAWGAKIVTREKTEGEQTIKTRDPKGVIHNLGLFFMAFESHTEQVTKNRKLTRHFDILAASKGCPVEVIQHRKRPLWGVQFHPEKSFPEGRQIAENLARIIAKGEP
ncbi:hypothetical protein GF359_08800, partial [candidate division WOR-3 bacterium]|nr:hypothetical protein [candidate division WOR-3 bacterium]MBD3365298.1 hypothetical protein [candidate division WOR-3 bacterium]